MNDIYVRHERWSGVWVVIEVMDDGRYICIRNSAAYSQMIMRPDQCTQISEREYEKGHTPAPDYRYDY